MLLGGLPQTIGSLRMITRLELEYNNLNGKLICVSIIIYVVMIIGFYRYYPIHNRKYDELDNICAVAQ